MAAQAADEAFIRYNPERSALTALLHELGGQRDAEVSAAKTGAKLISRSAKRAAKPLDKIYTDAASRSSAVQGALNADLAKLGPSAASLVAATNSGLASTGQSLQGARTRAAEEMAARRVDAVSSGRQEARNARASYRSESGKVLDRLIENEREAGTYASGRVAALAGERAGRQVTRQNNRDSNRQSERNSLRSAGIDPDTGKPLKTGKPKLSASERRARAEAKRGKTDRKAKRETRFDYIRQVLTDPPKYPDGHPNAGKEPTQDEVIAQLVKQKYSMAEIRQVLRRMKRPPTSEGPSGQQRPT
jgi:hypothetical protein